MVLFPEPLGPFSCQRFPLEKTFYRTYHERSNFALWYREGEVVQYGDIRPARVAEVNTLDLNIALNFVWPLA